MVFGLGRQTSALPPRVGRGLVLTDVGRPGEIPFGWDNETPGMVVDVPAFAIDVHDVTNEQFLDFVEAGGYRQDDWWTPEAFAWIQEARIEHPGFWTRRGGNWRWRAMFGEIDLPPAWPAYVLSLIHI